MSIMSLSSRRFRKREDLRKKNGYTILIYLNSKMKEINKQEADGDERITNIIALELGGLELVELELGGLELDGLELGGLELGELELGGLELDGLELGGLKELLS